jgi:DNA-binding MarR family transcriptional regulator
MPENAIDAVAGRLAFVVGRLNRRLVGASGGLSHALLSALATVAKKGPIRLADLAQVEMVSAPSITRVVAELETRGLVARSADPDDGRAYLMQVTEAGMAAVLRARAARAEVMAELLAELAPADVAAIADALPSLESIVGHM